MTKSEFIEALAKKIQVPQTRAEQIVNGLFGGLADAMKRRQSIEIRGFGSFSIREYKSYEGRNPRSGESVKVAPKRLPFFKVGKALKDAVDRAAGGNNADKS
jgi:integration host factor subunit beta